MTSRISRAALVSFFAIAGCGGHLPSVSTVIPNWPQSSGMTPEEVRQKREAEMAIYMTKPPAKTEPAASEPPQRAVPAAASPSGPTASPAPSAAPASGRRFEVAPELVAAAPPRAPSRESSAATSPKASVSLAPGAPAARYGDLLFISGQLPIDARGNPTPPDARFEDQARLALENVRGVLETNRLSLANVVSMTVYLRDLDDARAFDTLFASYFKGSQPARSIVEVSRLPSNARIEISAVAGR